MLANILMRNKKPQKLINKLPQWNKKIYNAGQGFHQVRNVPILNHGALSCFSKSVLCLEMNPFFYSWETMPISHATIFFNQTGSANHIIEREIEGIKKYIN